jgi:hypothetical protein
LTTFKFTNPAQFQRSNISKASSANAKSVITPQFFIDAEDERANSMYHIVTEEAFPRRDGDKMVESSGGEKKKDGTTCDNMIDTMADLQVSFCFFCDV